MILLFLACCGCGGGPTLISSSHEFVMPREIDDFSYYDDHENFIRQYFSVKYEENKIIATTLINTNCSDLVAAKIAVSNDTIFLENEVSMTADRLCPEFHKFTFIISNPENIKYKVVSTK